MSAVISDHPARIICIVCPVTIVRAHHVMSGDQEVLIVKWRRSEDNKECDCRCCAAPFIISYFIITIVLVPGRAGTREEREVHNDGLKHNNNVRFMPAIFYNHLIHLVLCGE